MVDLLGVYRCALNVFKGGVKGEAWEALCRREHVVDADETQHGGGSLLPLS